MLSTGALRAHLLAARLAGPVATSRENSLRSYRLFAAGDPRVTLGVRPDGVWGERELLGLMAERCGVSGDPGRVTGADTIDPERTLARLDAFAGRLAEAAARRAPVLFGTGHPERLTGFYAGLADALSAAGCTVLTPGRGRRVDITTRFGVRPYRLDYVRGVAFVREPGARGGSGGPGAHTHSPLPVRAALESAAEDSRGLPELVIGDHGWACGAGQLGFEAMGPADVNDPALFVGEAEGRVSVAVPLDDAVAAEHYLPLTRYVLNRACLSQ
ncbi:phosphatase [Streptomyces sp. NBC_00102]|uniref:phosphatase n=1 Tax=Streptomyces sp. NBC_00102 TaxID=2975652 RepID=UPI0022520A84|nr:phosphatase [Streptomyces sp. NBC_00102]MCX5398802.1 phosphatase [Streptomyces sp. NBC_00102]